MTMHTSAVREQSIDRSEATPRWRIVDDMTYVDIEHADATAWASLTKTERTLAALVAKGMTNRQVAERLFISRHTVDAHLRHIFRKLDINSACGSRSPRRAARTDRRDIKPLVP